MQGGRNGIILGEAPTNFGKKCHFFRHFYCLKSFHGPNLGEARASDFHQFRPPYLVNCLKICHIFGIKTPICSFLYSNTSGENFEALCKIISLSMNLKKSVEKKSMLLSNKIFHIKGIRTSFSSSKIRFTYFYKNHISNRLAYRQF